MPRVTETSSSASATPVWALPPALTDPRPVVLVCVVGWIVATVAILIVSGPSSSALPTCYAGLCIGAVGTLIFLAQRAAARHGVKGSQSGLG